MRHERYGRIILKILVINGPNMNMLGIREPEIYGRKTYDDPISYITDAAQKLGVEVSFFQSNSEGAIVDAIQAAYYDGTDAIIINPAAYTHTSIAIPDAIKAVGIPCVEVHISDPDTREELRHISYTRPVCVAVYKSMGFDGYVEAMRFLCSDKQKDD